MLHDALQDSELMDLIAETQALRAKIVALEAEIANLHKRIDLFYKLPED